MRKGIIASWLAALVLALAPASASAQRGRRELLRQKIHALRMARIMEIVAVDPRTRPKLEALFNKAFHDVDAIVRDSGEARRELRALLDTERADDARLNALVDRLIGNKARLDALQATLVRDLRRLLAPRQVARLVLVMPEIERGIEQRIRRAARKAGGPVDYPPIDDQ